MLDKQGAAHPEDVAVLGTEEQIETQLRQLKEAGTTDFVGVHIRLRRRAHAHRRVPELARADALARSIPSPSGELRVNQLQSAPRRRGRVAALWSRCPRLRGGDFFIDLRAVLQKGRSGLRAGG